MAWPAAHEGCEIAGMLGIIGIGQALLLCFFCSEFTYTPRILEYSYSLEIDDYTSNMRFFFILWRRAKTNMEL